MRFIFFVVSLCAFAFGSAGTMRGAPQGLATFQLGEQFGVSWPEQPIEFRYDGGKPAADTRMIGPTGVEVPFQWVSSCADSDAKNGCILVRSALPANVDYTWALQAGASPSVAVLNSTQLIQTGSNYEITNGLTGVRIVTAAGNSAPFNRAPIQGIMLPNGKWTGTGSSPNLLYAEPKNSPGCVGCALTTPMNSATAYNVSVIESGPLKVSLKVTYAFARPRYSYGVNQINTAGAGHYTLIVTLYANSKSVLIDEDSDMQFSYYLPVYKELMPDRAQFRGHDSLDSSGSPNPSCGYETPLGIRGATSGSPLVISATGSVANGQRVKIAGIQGIAAANGTFYAKTSGYAAGQFALYQDAALTSPVTGSGAWLGGGSVQPAYRGQNVNPAGDAYLDLTYTGDRPAAYICYANGYRKLVADYTSAAHSAPWYIEMFNSTGGTVEFRCRHLYRPRFTAVILRPRDPRCRESTRVTSTLPAGHRTRVFKSTIC